MLKRENILRDNKLENHNGFVFEEISNISKINLRGNINDKDFLTKVGKILNCLLPLEANTSIKTDKLKIFWLSPNEWLIETNNEIFFKEKFSELEYSLDPKKTAVTDVTENRSIIRMSGLNLYKLLAKFLVIDLDEVLKKENSILQTIFLKVQVLIVRNHKDNDNQCLDIHVNRSYINYIYNLLLDGSKNLDF